MNGKMVQRIRDITVNETSFINVTVTDVNGCTGSSSVQVIFNNNPLPQISGSTAFCDGGSTTLGLTDVYESYEWSDNSTNDFLDVATEGTYEVTVTDINGCTGSSSIVVTLEDSLNPIITGPDFICSGESIDLNAGLGFDSYDWGSGPGTDNILVVNAGGTYEVTVTDISGCTGTSSVAVMESSATQVVISGSLNYCAQSNTTITAEGTYDDYIWSNGINTAAIIVDSPGSYSVTVTDANGLYKF